VLFVPGDRVDQVEAALRSGADSIVIDLEEPRTPFPEAAREAARENDAASGSGCRPRGPGGAARSSSTSRNDAPGT